MMFLLVQAKSKQSPIASRTRGSLNWSRRVLRCQPWVVRRRAVVQDLLLHPAVLGGGEVVSRRPEARGVLLVIVDRSGLERLERDLPLPIIFEAQAIEVVLAQVDRQLGAPIIGIARIFDEPALLERLDLVGAGTQRRIERRRGEIAPLPPRRREHGHADNDKMRVAAAPLDKAHMDDVVAFRIRPIPLPLGAGRRSDGPSLSAR